MKYKKQLGLFLLFCIFFMLVSCFSAAPFPTLSAEEVRLLGISCEEIYSRQINAWDSREPENLRQVYTDDIVHFDGYPAYIGIGKVIGMAEGMFKFFPEWQMEAGETFVSRDKCLGIWVNWDIFEFTKDNPGLEYDLIETKDHKISFWRLFYQPGFFGADGRTDEFLQQFASVWSQGDSEEIQNLYTKDADFEDTLFGFSITGQRKISGYVDSIFEKAPKASWELLFSFYEGEAKFLYKEEYPFPSQGGVFTITVKDTSGNPCKIYTVVILTPNEDGVILRQETFYDADSLVACGWAE